LDGGQRTPSRRALALNLSTFSLPALSELEFEARPCRAKHWRNTRGDKPKRFVKWRRIVSTDPKPAKLIST